MDSGISRQRGWELHFGSGAIRNELADDEAHDDHLMCKESGLIIKFEESLIEALQEGIAVSPSQTLRLGSAYPARATRPEPPTGS